MPALVWAAIFSMLAIIACLMEVLTPVFGGFTVVAGICVFAATWFASQHSTVAAVLVLAFNFISVPLTVLLSVRLMRHSPLALDTENATGTLTAPGGKTLVHLAGKHGTAATPLRPGGAALIGDERVDVMSRGTYVDTGTPIRVVSVEGARVVVEPIPQPPEKKT